MQETVRLLALLPLRLMVGAGLAYEGWGKLMEGWMHGNEVHNAMVTWLDKKRTYSFFIPFVEHFRDHPKIFGTLLTLGELGIGACLVVGLLNRPLSLLGFVMTLSIALGAGQGPVGNATILAAVFLCFMLASPGRVLGIDRKLKGRLGSWLI